MDKKSVLKKIILSLVIIFLILVMVLLLWLKFGNWGQAKENVALKLSYPIKLVGGKPIPIKEFEERLDLAKIYFEDKENLNYQIAEQLVLEKKTEILANRYGIEPNQKTIQNEFEYIKKEESLYIEKFNLTDELLKNKILTQENLKNQLKIWFNSKEEFNKKEYNTAQGLLERIEKGESIEALALIYSKDETGRLLQGDLGFLEISSLLPEFQEALDLKEAGIIELVPSRFGLHILGIEDKKEQKLHLRQIFIPINNFESWFQNELEQITTINLVKI